MHINVACVFGFYGKENFNRRIVSSRGSCYLRDLGIITIVGQMPIDSDSPTLYTYQTIKTYPHDTNAFTEGLVFDNGVLFESTGEYGFSSLRRVDLETGDVQDKILLSDQYFGEGLAVVNNSLVQLTWREKIGFIYNKESLDLIGNFSYSSEGWGLNLRWQ